MSLICRQNILAVLGVSAKVEHRRILDRTVRGYAAAKAQGIMFGRKSKLTPHQQKETLARREKGEESMRQIAEIYNVDFESAPRCA